MDGIAKLAIDLLMKPGASISLVPFINIAILSLFGVLCFLLSFANIDIIHIVVMATLALCLLVSVNWVYFEIIKMKEAGSDPFAPIALTADGKRMTNSSDKKTD